MLSHSLSLFHDPLSHYSPSPRLAAPGRGAKQEVRSQPALPVFVCAQARSGSTFSNFQCRVQFHPSSYFWCVFIFMLFHVHVFLKLLLTTTPHSATTLAPHPLPPHFCHPLLKAAPRALAGLGGTNAAASAWNSSERRHRPSHRRWVEYGTE